MLIQDKCVYSPFFTQLQQKNQLFGLPKSSDTGQNQPENKKSGSLGSFWTLGDTHYVEWRGRMKDQPTDEQLLSRLSVDPQAMRLLLERHGAYLQGLARSLTRSETEADDAVQETLMALLKARFDGRSSVRTFIVSVLIRRAAVLRRKRRGWLRIVPEVEESPHPESVIQAVDARLDLATILQKLTPEYREVIVMRELESMSYDEMAKVLGVPKGTVESRLHRAREQLKQILNHRG